MTEPDDWIMPLVIGGCMGSSSTGFVFAGWCLVQHAYWAAVENLLIATAATMTFLVVATVLSIWADHRARKRWEHE